ncbi:hypothetical protein M5D96_013954 [Drosophila gunungcola]|uniref:Uncharacterized protein n=2 Tax=Drosophila gunungcola TaxID=103775 RepID=A0A9P9YAB8_9MUSC|nr:hypothetical protein M5D96_013954 [Drosophila gunungcola]
MSAPLPDSYSPYQHQHQHARNANANANAAMVQDQNVEQDLDNAIGGEQHALLEVLKNSHISACTDVQTLDSTPSLVTDENGLASNGFIHSILTRRLGLIVGCCLGIIVFIVMISVLSYVKLKKQRIENAKRQAALPPEYISYRHFSIPNEELTRTAANAGAAAAAAAAAAASAAAANKSGDAGSPPHMSSVPSGISAHISGTSLSTGGTGTGTTTTTATTPIGGVPIMGVGVGVGVGVGKAGSPLAGVVDSDHTHNAHGHAHGHAHAHRQNNGYMAAGVVLNTNHLSVC